MIINIRELLDFHTRFDTGEGFFITYADSVREKYTRSGIINDYSITLTDTHKKLIAQAQKQHLLHRDIGYVRALQLTDTVNYYDVGFKTIDGGLFSRGTSLSLDDAVARSFGELYERVSLRFVPEEQPIIYKSYKQLKAATPHVVNIHNFAKATDQQKILFPEMAWDDDSVFGWVEIENIYTGQQTFVPAQLVYWGYKRGVDEPLLSESNTNGLGAGYTHESAFLSGASELLQRHSFFTYWYSKEAPPRIKPSSVLRSSHASNDTKTLIQAVREYGFTIHLLDCTIEKGAPSIAAVLTKPGLGWFLGMTTNDDAGKAIERALCEALSIYVWTMNEVGHPQASTLMFDAQKIKSGFSDKEFNSRIRVYAWSKEEVAKNGEFFLKGEEQTFDTVYAREAQSIRAVFGSITNNQVFIKSAKQPYLDDVKFHSVRVVAPHLHKLTLLEGYSTPIVNGVLPKNVFPHPFP
jgi:thiazole/oxazole-forming peptide maturase SagD family component